MTILVIRFSTSGTLLNTVGTVLFVLFLCFFLCFDLYGLTEEERKIVMGA